MLKKCQTMDDFSFKYVPESELSKIVKEVKRERRKKNEEKEWEEYLESRRLKFLSKTNKPKLLLPGLSDAVTCNGGDSDIHLDRCGQHAVKSFVSAASICGPGDGKSSSVVECDSNTESLSLDLENLKKLDKLRIFDFANQAALTCSSDCGSQVYHHRGHCHLNDSIHDQNHHHYHRHHCQEVDERSQDIRNLKSVGPACQLFSVKGVVSDTLADRDGASVCMPKQSSNHFIRRTDSKSKHESIKKGCSSSSCINLQMQMEGVAGNSVDSCTDKKHKVISDESKTKICTSRSNEILPNLSCSGNHDPKTGHSKNPDDSVNEMGKRSMSCKSESMFPSNSLAVVHDQQKASKTLLNTSDCLSLELSGEVLSIPDSASEIHSNGNFHKSQKSFKTLTVIQEENLLLGTNETEMSTSVVNLETSSKISERLLCDADDCYLPVGDLDACRGDGARVNQLNKNQVIAPFDNESKVRIDSLKARLKSLLCKILDTCGKNKGIQDDVDFERQMKKTKEFVSRFSRNYLYQLRRQIEIIKKLNLSTCSTQIFYQKLFLSYQTSLQALQAFQNILPDESRISFDKVEEFLKLFLSLLDFSENQFDDYNDNKEMKVLCNTLIATLKNNADRRNGLKNVRTKNLPSRKIQNENEFGSMDGICTGNSDGITKKRSVKKQKSPKKLSMYCTSGNTNLSLNWKKTSATLARKKFGSPNKKMPNDVKKSEDNKNKVSASTKLVGDCEESSDFINKSDVVASVDRTAAKELDKRLPNDEDGVFCNKNISTTDISHDKNSSSPGPYKFESSLHLEPAVELGTAIENCPIDVSKADDSNNLELPKDCEERTKMFLLFDKLSEIMVQNTKENEQFKLKNGLSGEDKPETRINISEEEMKRVLQQIHEMYLHPESLGLTRNSLDEKCPITISNNNHLITKNETFKNKEEKRCKDTKVKPSLKNVSFTSVHFNEDEHKLTRKNISTKQNQDSENAGSTIPLIELDILDEQLQSILKYRNNFVNYTELSPFYEQFDERWNIVKRISDNLLSKLVSDVSKELEINLLIQKMYELEFTHHILNTVPVK